MREIKFRAWDKLNGEQVMMSHQACLNRGLRVENLMQFTGLTDKNGVVIYEGDVVKIHNLEENWKHREPDFDWRMFVVEWNRYTWAYNNPSLYMVFSDYDSKDLTPWDIEVIGNIYENPELIEKGI